jgi:hypothetical protein
MAKPKKRVNKGKPVGSPTKYQAVFADHAFKYALLGATDAEMAEFFGVTLSTFYLWQQKHPQFSDAVKRGKTPSDADVANSLHTKAIGYERVVQKPVVVKDSDGSTSVQVVDTIEQVPGDTAAQIFWLKNRQRGKWRDKHELEHTGAGGGPIQQSQLIAISDLNPEQREQLRAILLGAKRPAGLITDVEHEVVDDQVEDDEAEDE